MSSEPVGTVQCQETHQRSAYAVICKMETVAPKDENAKSWPSDRGEAVLNGGGVQQTVPVSPVVRSDQFAPRLSPE